MSVVVAIIPAYACEAAFVSGLAAFLNKLKA
jgi:hypothetical protein